MSRELDKTEATALSGGAGVGIGGNPIGDGANGIATETAGRGVGDPEAYEKFIDEKIMRIRPMSTPVDQISRSGTSKKVDSFEVKYYSVGTRPVMTTVKTKVEKQTTNATVAIQVNDPSIFTLDDTILVKDVKATTKPDGTAYGVGDTAPLLMLLVCGKDPTTHMPVVCAVNGDKDARGQRVLVPEIKQGAQLVRMGKACAELDVQTGRFNILPTAEVQHCQNFMMQVEQSTFDKIAKKEYTWDFSDLEEDGIYDMRLAQELSYLFGALGCLKHPAKDNLLTWTTGGIWYQAGKDIELGHWDEKEKKAVISDDDLVDISRDLFCGTGEGSKRKIAFLGSDALAELSKIKSDKFRLKDSVECWNLKFKSWETDFGEILTMHHEAFDTIGLSDSGLVIDPELLQKATYVGWNRSVLDLKSAGVRRTDAVVLQEVSALYLRHPKSHARIKLAQKSKG